MSFENKNGKNAGHNDHQKGQEKHGQEGHKKHGEHKQGQAAPQGEQQKNGWCSAHKGPKAKCNCA